MIEIKLHDVIANEDHKWYYCWDDTEGVFSLEFVQKLFENNPDEKDFKFNIHCPGGEVEEGLAIYDCLRTSGKNIYMNIEGSCHSMAVTLLLAAPKENRTANPNCVALIHQVQSWACGSVEELERAAAEARTLQDKIINIYSDRTGMSKEDLQAIMDEQKERTAQELLEWGFISRVNTYNTNIKKTNISKTQITMSKAKNLKQKASDFLNSLRNFVGEAVNYEFTDGDGNVLFTTEEEDDTLVVGETKASPDGVFTIADGRTITIEDGVVTAIEEPGSEGGEGGEGGDGGEGGEGGDENLQTENANLRTENADLKAKLVEATNLIKELRSNIKSDYVPGTRHNTQKPAQPKQKTASDYKAEIKKNRENRKQSK